MGSLTGVVASKSVTEASQGTLSTNGNRAESAMAQGCLTVRQTSRSGAKAGHNRSKDKRYSGDNRLIAAKSSYRRGGLAPRGWRRSQGFGCSPIKVARELGSERRETVRSLSVVGVGNLRGPDFSTRGPSWTNLWCTGYAARCSAG